MTQDEFERLLSDWLDGPHAENTAAVNAAVAANPEFARLRCEWVEFDQRIRRHAPAMDRVVWTVLHARIAAAIAAQQRSSLAP